MKLYLITGFLGAGKTTLLKNLIGLMCGRKLKVIVNEFGKAGIDGTLLQELGASVDEISNGSIFCSCRLDQFEEVLTRTISEGPDVILVETSGLSDPTNVKKILNHERFSRIDYKGCICMVDAVNIKKVISTARVCKKQISVSDILIINKTDLISDTELNDVKRLLTEQKPGVIIYNTAFGVIQPEWLDFAYANALAHSSAPYHLKDVSLIKTTIAIKETMTKYQLEKFLQMFIEDTYRIKGFVCLEKETLLVDCVGADLKISPYKGDVTNCNCIVAMAGPGLPMDASLRQAAEWYPEFIEKIE